MDVIYPNLILHLFLRRFAVNQPGCSLEKRRNVSEYQATIKLSSMSTNQIISWLNFTNFLSANIRKTNKTPALRRGERKDTLDQVSRELSTPVTDDNTHSDLQSSSLAIDQHLSQNEPDNEIVPVLESIVPSQVDAHDVNGLNESTVGEPKNDVLEDDIISNGMFPGINELLDPIFFH